MATLSAPFPDLHDLRAGLAGLLVRRGPGAAALTILKRKRNVNSSTFASEIVTCQLPVQGQLRLLCKYGAGPTDVVYGHKGGVEYEAAVYRHVLQPPRDGAATVAFYGAHTDAATGLTWLVLEYLEDSARLHLTADPARAMALAARWLGAFHRTVSVHRIQATAVLNTYDEDYYLGWAQRTLQFARPLQPRLPWLVPLCRRFEELVLRLLASAPTIIHGEYYPKNILIRDDCIYPIDWESAAHAVGEIDLATLTEGWTSDVVRRCEQEYERARWPGGASDGFLWRVAVCRMYGLFRWLGDRPEWTTGRGALQQFKQLRFLGRQLGVI